MIRVYLRLSAAGILALLAAGCAELRWHKPGAESAILEQDLGQCRQEARARAARETLPRALTSPPRMGADAQGRPIIVQSSSRDADRVILEQELTSDCMRGKGYDLVPVERSDQ